jgi:pyridinium-3,5-biscarboxylic acid mononucleotide sulfurtransferase
VSSKSTENHINLVNWFLTNADKVIVALSGGVDSAVVALAAKEALGINAMAITANYKTLSKEEISTANKIAAEIFINHKIIEYDELKNSEFVKNDEMRCYHCRTELAEHLIVEANRYGIKIIVDGTNIDDLADYRPGIQALRENGIRSPLVELGINKDQIRSIARLSGLSLYDKPSNACLASRIPRGIEVTFEKLRKIEKSEIIVKNIFNVRQVRVRDHGEIARIEVDRNELTKLFDIDKLTILDTKLKELGFRFVSIDVSGYRSGNLIVVE